MKTARTLIVGIGSPHGDDQAGWQVADRLAQQLDADRAEVRKAANPVDLLHWLEGVESLHICDACQGLGGVGTRRRWRWPARQLVDASWSGSHDLPLPAVLRLAEQLGRLPARVTLWAVEGSTPAAGEDVSPAVAETLPQIAADIIRETMLCTNSHS